MTIGARVAFSCGVNLIIELEAVIAATIVAIVAPRLGVRLFRPLTRAFRQIARRRRTCVVLVFLLVLTVLAALGIFWHQPIPFVHDDFGHLLIGDTFASGRLSNPTHPHWEHFESYHLFHQPSYQAKFPPAQGAVLALGQILFDSPQLGVWLSVAAACAAVCWMLQGWVPSRWALLGGILTATNPGILLFWGQNYWGGAVAMLGGALVFGAVPRIMNGDRYRDAVPFGVGLALLANSRPYEGLIVSIPATLALIVGILRSNHQSLVHRLLRVGLPIGVIMLATFGWIATYNQSVTGSAFRLPYQHWLSQHASNYHLANLLWGVPNEEPIGGRVAMHLPDTQQQWKSRTTSARGSLLRKYVRIHFFYLRFALAIPLVGLYWTGSRKQLRLPIAACLLLLTAVLMAETIGHAHYFAPATGVTILLVIEGMRRIRLWRWRGRPSGQFLVQMIPVICLFTFVCSLAHWISQPVPSQYDWRLDRVAMQRQLEALGGSHLVLVRYDPQHRYDFEWVYNRANIDKSTIVWARELDPKRNEGLLDYFRDRQAWLLEADVTPRRLLPHPGSKLSLLSRPCFVAESHWLSPESADAQAHHPDSRLQRRADTLRNLKRSAPRTAGN